MVVPLRIFALQDSYGLPTIKNTIVTTAIIRAGRKSLDLKKSIGLDVNAAGDIVFVGDS